MSPANVKDPQSVSPVSEDLDKHDISHNAVAALVDKIDAIVDEAAASRWSIHALASALSEVDWRHPATIVVSADKPRNKTP